MVKHLWELAIGFGKASILGYGGGPASIPLVENEAVSQYEWVTKDEFGQILAMGNALPGPIATKIAGYIGYKVAGIMGATVAVLATILPTILIMILLITPLLKFKDVPFVKGMINGVKPTVFVMLALLAFEYSKFAFIDLRYFILAILAFAMIHYLHINPGWVVLGSLVLGGIFLR